MTIGLNAWHGKHPCLGQIIKYIGLRKAGKEKVLKNSDRKIQIASPNVAWAMSSSFTDSEYSLEKFKKMQNRSHQKQLTMNMWDMKIFLLIL